MFLEGVFPQQKLHMLCFNDPYRVALLSLRPSQRGAAGASMNVSSDYLCDVCCCIRNLKPQDGEFIATKNGPEAPIYISGNVYQCYRLWFYLASLLEYSKLFSDSVTFTDIALQIICGLRFPWCAIIIPAWHRLKIHAYTIQLLIIQLWVLTDCQQHRNCGIRLILIH